jgi:hypothetical protein
MLHSSERKPASAGPLEELTVVDAAEKITRLADQRKKRVPQDFPSFPADKLPSAVVVRLHFAEAMMMLLFNALDEKQRESVKQGIARVLDSVDTSEIPGGRQDIMRAYKDALTAMHSPCCRTLRKIWPALFPPTLQGNLRRDRNDRFPTRGSSLREPRG